MTIDSHVYSAQMHAARLHDNTRGSLTVQTLLARAEQKAGSAKYGTAVAVRIKVAKANKSLHMLAALL